MDVRAVISLVFFIAAVFIVESDALRCSYGYQLRYHHQCYLFVTTHNRTWQDAETSCQGHYGHLVEIDDIAEQKYLDQYLKNHTSKYHTSIFWTSGTKLYYGLWYWYYNGRPMNYTNWASQQPGGIEECMIYGPGRGYKWTVDNCDSEYNYICEISDYM